MEEGSSCDVCGIPVQFFDDDWMKCSGFEAEESNMDHTGDQLIEEFEQTLELQVLTLVKVFTVVALLACCWHFA